MLVRCCKGKPRKKIPTGVIVQLEHDVSRLRFKRLQSQLTGLDLRDGPIDQSPQCVVPRFRSELSEIIWTFQ